MAQSGNNGRISARDEGAFFELLRSGLWGTLADPSAFGLDTDWDSIYRLARIQTVAGLVFEGMMTLPEALRPESGLLRKWYVMIVSIERSHALLNDVIAETFTLYRQGGFHPVLIKGQGVAQCYRDPIRRQCGDVDIYVGRDDYDKVNKMIEDMGRMVDSHDHITHVNFKYKGVDIENHVVVLSIADPRSDRYFSGMVSRWYPHEVRTTVINETPIALPPAGFDAVYILAHAVCHFFVGGIGLRQLCDWVRVLHSLKDEIDHEKLERDIKGMGYESIWKVFGCVAVDYLGLSENEMPFYDGSYSEKASKVIEIVLREGNFGTARERTERPKGYLRGKLHGFGNNVDRWRSIYSVFPKESFVYFVHFFKNGIRNIIKDKF